MFNPLSGGPGGSDEVTVLSVDGPIEEITSQFKSILNEPYKKDVPFAVGNAVVAN